MLAKAAGDRRATQAAPANAAARDQGTAEPANLGIVIVVVVDAFALVLAPTLAQEMGQRQAP